MTAPTPDLPALRDSTDRLLCDLDAAGWSETDVGASSLLPGWTRGHVLTHLARHADGVCRTLAGALRGERVPRYAGGAAGRAAEIEAGAGRASAAQLADVRESAGRLDEVLGAVAAVDGWGLPTDDRPAGAHVLSRWREVEIRRVDLAGPYTARDWPAAFVGYLLPATVGELDDRIPDGHALRIEVESEGSVTDGLGGTVWSCGQGSEPQAVAGPDWALLAWALGRDNATGGALGDPPTIARWL